MRPSRSRLLPTSSRIAEAQVADDLHALHRVDVVVHVAHADAVVFEKPVRSSAIFFVSVVTSTRSLRAVRSLISNQVVDLPVGRLHRDLRVQKAGWADDLLDDRRRFLQLHIARRRAHEHRLIDMPVKLIEIQRAVVVSRGQAEAVVDRSSPLRHGRPRTSSDLRTA